MKVLFIFFVGFLVQQAEPCTQSFRIVTVTKKQLGNPQQETKSRGVNIHRTRAQSTTDQLPTNFTTIIPEIESTTSERAGWSRPEIYVTLGQVPGGAHNGMTKRTEVIPMRPDEANFKADFPVAIEAPWGAYIDYCKEKKPFLLVCGTGDKSCYILEQGNTNWVRSDVVLKQERYRPAITRYPTGELWVLGGSDDMGIRDRTEILLPDTCKFSELKDGKMLPQTVHFTHGLRDFTVTQVSKYEYIAIGGYDPQWGTQDRVSFIDLSSQCVGGNCKWTQLNGLDLRENKRQGHLAFLTKFNKAKALILLGGSPAKPNQATLNSASSKVQSCHRHIAEHEDTDKDNMETLVLDLTEPLDPMKSKWQPGPSLRHTHHLEHASVVQVNGYHYIVGGNVRTSKLILYRHDQSFFQYYEQQYTAPKLPRQDPVVILMPKNFSRDTFDRVPNEPLEKAYRESKMDRKIMRIFVTGGRKMDSSGAFLQSSEVITLDNESKLSSIRGSSVQLGENLINPFGKYIEIDKGWKKVRFIVICGGKIWESSDEKEKINCYKMYSGDTKFEYQHYFGFMSKSDLIPSGFPSIMIPYQGYDYNERGNVEKSLLGIIQPFAPTAYVDVDLIDYASGRGGVDNLPRWKENWDRINQLQYRYYHRMDDYLRSDGKPEVITTSAFRRLSNAQKLCCQSLVVDGCTMYLSGGQWLTGVQYDQPLSMTGKRTMQIDSVMVTGNPYLYESEIETEENTKADVKKRWHMITGHEELRREGHISFIGRIPPKGKEDIGLTEGLGNQGSLGIIIVGGKKVKSQKTNGHEYYTRRPRDPSLWEHVPLVPFKELYNLNVKNPNLSLSTRPKHVGYFFKDKEFKELGKLIDYDDIIWSNYEMYQSVVVGSLDSTNRIVIVGGSKSGKLLEYGFSLRGPNKVPWYDLHELDISLIQPRRGHVALLIPSDFVIA